MVMYCMFSEQDLIVQFENSIENGSLNYLA